MAAAPQSRSGNGVGFGRGRESSSVRGSFWPPFPSHLPPHRSLPAALLPGAALYLELTHSHMTAGTSRTNLTAAA